MELINEPDPGEIPISAYVEAFAAFREEHQLMLTECTNGNDMPADGVRHLIAAALRRSAGLIEGFLVLTDARNRFCAIPLVRLQLDSAMRIHACGMISQPWVFVKHILDGGEPRRYRSECGLDLSDRALHSSLTKRYPYTSDLYQETNAYVHLSRQHLFGVLDLELLKTDGNVQFTSHELLPPWDDDAVKGTCVSMLWATHVLTEECKSLMQMHPMNGSGSADNT